MLRFAILAYLTMSVALGPALCCCSTHMLFPGSVGSGCCENRQASHVGHSHAHSHQHHGEGHCHHDSHSVHHKEVKRAAEPEPEPNQHNPDDCACGKNRETLFRTSNSDATAKLTDTFAYVFLAFDVDPTLAQSTTLDFTPRLEHHFRHAELSGREILRAYNRLQC